MAMMLLLRTADGGGDLRVDELGELPAGQGSSRRRRSAARQSA